MTEDLRYPIGEFDRNYENSAAARQERIKTIAELPKRVHEGSRVWTKLR